MCSLDTHMPHVICVWLTCDKTCHDTHSYVTRQSWHTYEWVVSHKSSHRIHMSESCCKKWVPAHICMSHVIHQSWHTYAWVMSYINHSVHMSGSRERKWVIAHTWVSHFAGDTHGTHMHHTHTHTHMHQSRHTSFSVTQLTYMCAMSHLPRNVGTHSCTTHVYVCHESSPAKCRNSLMHSHQSRHTSNMVHAWVSHVTEDESWLTYEWVYHRKGRKSHIRIW